MVQTFIAGDDQPGPEMTAGGPNVTLTIASDDMPFGLMVTDDPSEATLTSTGTCVPVKTESTTAVTMTLPVGAGIVSDGPPGESFWIATAPFTSMSGGVSVKCGGSVKVTPFDVGAAGVLAGLVAT
jgi:hypothetical protein